MVRTWAATLGAVAGAVLACSPVPATHRAPPPEPELRIWVPSVIHWSAGADRALEFAIENGTERTLEIPPPDPKAARVAVFVDAEDAQVCGVEAGARRPDGSVRLAPGEQAPVRVDLGEACGGLPPGEYRYELGYRAPRAGGGNIALTTRYGTLIVDEQRRAARRPPVSPRPPAPGP